MVRLIGTKEDGLQESGQCRRGFQGRGDGERGFGTALYEDLPVGAVKIREKFAGTVVMVDAVAEPNSFGIDHKLLPARVFSVALVVLDNLLQGFSNQEVVPVVLIPDDVVTGAGCLAEVVKQFLLRKAQFLETRNSVAQDL